MPDGSDLAGGAAACLPQSSSFSAHTVIAADSQGGGTWVGALEYSDPALLALGTSPAAQPQTPNHGFSAGVSSRPLLQKQMLLVGGGEGVVSMKWFGWLQQWHVTYADASCCIFDGSTGQLLRHVKDAHSFPVPSLSSILAAAPEPQTKSSSSSRQGIFVKNGFVAMVCSLFLARHLRTCNV